MHSMTCSCLDAKSRALLKSVNDQLDITKCVNAVGMGFDTQEWKTLRNCFCETLELDYQSLSGQPAATLKADALIETWKVCARPYMSCVCHACWTMCVV